MNSHPTREALPVERNSITKRFSIGANFQAYATVGLYSDGRPGELFVVMHKVGTIERGLCDSVARLVSMALQRGIPLDDICGRLIGQRFEPAGVTGDSEFPMVLSFGDYLGRWMKARFLECRESSKGEAAAYWQAMPEPGKEQR